MTEHGSDDSSPRPVPLPDLVPLEESRVDVAESGYPSEVVCRMCRNLMLPDDAEGSSWACYVCGRRVRVMLGARPADS